MPESDHPNARTSHTVDPSAFSTPSRPTRGYMLGPDEGVPGRDREVKCSNQSTAGSLALYHTVVDGDGPPPHQHTHEDETIVVLSGELRVECGDDTWTGGPGTTFFLPRGLTHAFASVDGPATLVFIVTPGRLDEFFRLKEHATSDAEVAELARLFF